MAIPGGKPCPVLPRVPPVQWTVVAIAMGGGDRGGLPLPAGGYPYVPLQNPRPPAPGGGQYVGYPGKAVSRDATPRIV